MINSLSCVNVFLLGQEITSIKAHTQRTIKDDFTKKIFIN